MGSIVTSFAWNFSARGGRCAITWGSACRALDTRLGKDFVSGTFVPRMKGVAGIFVDRQKSLSISSWYQASLTDAAVSQSYQYEAGLGLAYFFDW